MKSSGAPLRRVDAGVRRVRAGGAGGSRTEVCRGLADEAEERIPRETVEVAGAGGGVDVKIVAKGAMDTEWGGAGAAPPPGASTLLAQTRDDFREERVTLKRSNTFPHGGAAPQMAAGVDVSLSKAAATLERELASEDAKAACEEAAYVERVLLRTGRCIAKTKSANQKSTSRRSFRVFPQNLQVTFRGLLLCFLCGVLINLPRV